MSPAKRMLDLTSSLAGLLVLSPLFAVVALLIRLDDGGPVFFRQERIGRRGRAFKILKFRTMKIRQAADEKLITVGGDSRITRVGSFLRQCKIDELPQLVNVVKGEMSLVGPRPEVSRYVALYTEEQKQVLEAVPGITDPASIRFRDESDLLAQSPDPEATYVNEIMPEKLRLNLQYLRSANLASDLRILAQTLRVIAS